MHGTLDLPTLQTLAEMAALAAGGWQTLAQRPYYVHYAEPLSPLSFPEGTVDRILFCAEHAIPLICGPVTLGGATAPVTGAGNLASCLAESLGGLVLAQLKRRGAPVIIGGVPTIMDMSTMTMSYGTPELSLWSAALVEMAHYLRLPVMGTAGCSDAVKFDEQAAAESAITCLMAALSGANLVHDVGFIEVAMAASLELIAATDEFISLIRTIMAGLPITPEALALDTIDAVGPGGSYLQEKHTARNFRDNWFPTLMNRRSYEQWTEAGGRSLADRANERVRQILRQHQPEPLPPEVIAELDKIEKAWWQKVS
jgi:trimethylamine--corrinoid protein Co-methyltransferase